MKDYGLNVGEVASDPLNHFSSVHSFIISMKEMETYLFWIIYKITCK
jgi:hypothetical protein